MPEFDPDVPAEAAAVIAELQNHAVIKLIYGGVAFVIMSKNTGAFDVEAAFDGVVIAAEANAAASAAAASADAATVAALIADIENAVAAAGDKATEAEGFRDEVFNYLSQLGNVVEADVIANTAAIAQNVAAIAGLAVGAVPVAVAVSGNIANGAFLTAKSNAGAIDLAIPNAGDYYVKVVRDGSNLVKVTGGPADHEIDIDNTGVEMWKTDGVTYVHAFTVIKSEVI